MRFIFLILLFGATSCIAQTKHKNIVGTYAGSWARSTFTYSFMKDNTFSLTTKGHFGNTFTSGNFSIVEDTIFLTPYSKKNQQSEYSLTNTQVLLIDGDSCIIDLSVGYDYCKQNKTDKFIHNSRRKSVLNNTPAKID